MSCTHNRHVAGCPTCRANASRYDRRRRAAIADGTWLSRVDVSSVLPHLVRLHASGMSLASIARAAGVSVRTVSDARNRRRRTLNGPVAAALLAVAPTRRIPAGMVDATATARRIQALMAIGYSLRSQACYLGRPIQRIWKLAHGQGTVTQQIADAVVQMYDQLCLTPGPSVRARNIAARNGWSPPLAWDDDTIGAPDAQPAGGEPGTDWLAIEQALNGQRPVHLLHSTDKAELYRRLVIEQGMTSKRLRSRFRLSQWQVAALRHAYAEQVEA